MREHTATIEKMAFGGAGICRVEGKVCFVPYTAYGDTVRIAISSEKKSYLEGKLLEVLEASPQRTVPECPVFGICGGCDWQHIAYDAQLQAKEDIFAEILWRTGRVDRSCIEPVAAASEPYGYRTRVQLKMRFAKGERHIGFFMAGSHFVVNLPGRCAIACEAVNTSYSELCAILGEYTEPDKIPQIDISSGDDGDVIVVFHYIGGNRKVLIDFLNKNRASLNHAAGVFLQSGRKTTIGKVYGKDSISYTIPEPVFREPGPLVLKTGRGGFSQVNYSQNNVMIDTVLKWVHPSGNERILDLYCGNGNFSLPLARYARQVLGLEEYEQSIKDAARNRDENRLGNAGFEAVDSVAGVKKLIEAGENFDVVLLDPPRAGAAEVVRLIPSLRPQKIVYISCDPPTLGRDIAYLKKLNYDVVKSRPVDMFPQTYHIESITLLERCR